MSSTAEVVLFRTSQVEARHDSLQKTYLPSVAVLLCTYQGEDYLEEQLDSIHSQLHQNLRVWVSDDGSRDRTKDILQRSMFRWGKDSLSIKAGPQQGYVKNFLTLTASPEIEADYYAFADQDDIWEPDKLSRAIEKLEKVPEGIPALYCSRTRLMNDKGENIGFSPLFKKPPAFANALIQNIGGGNTMVMNKAARKILSATEHLDVVNHDWWAYMVISGVGGRVIYDENPSIRYRQHDYNQVGANCGLGGRFYRLKRFLQGRFRNRNTINTDALWQISDLLAPENQKLLEQFCLARKAWLLPRLWGLWRSGVYRQNWIDNLGIYAGAILNKV